MALSSSGLWMPRHCKSTTTHTAVLYTVPAQEQRRRHQRVSRYLLLLWTAQHTVDTRHFLLRLRTGIGSVWRWVDADDYRPPALLVQEKRHLDGRWPGGFRLLPPGCVFWRSGYQAQTSQANNSGDAVGSLHRLISATRGGSAPSSWSRVDRRRTGGASNHDIVALRELTAPVCPVQALGFSSVDPQTKAFSHFSPLLP